MICRVGSDFVGFATDEVQGVAALTDLTPMPGAPPLVAGLVCVGDVLYGVISLRALLMGAPPAEQTEARVVLGVAKGQRLAVAVDEVTARIADENLGPGSGATVAEGGGICESSVGWEGRRVRMISFTRLVETIGRMRAR